MDALRRKIRAILLETLFVDGFGLDDDQILTISTASYDGWRKYYYNRLTDTFDDLTSIHGQNVNMASAGYFCGKNDLPKATAAAKRQDIEYRGLWPHKIRGYKYENNRLVPDNSNHVENSIKSPALSEADTVSEVFDSGPFPYRMLSSREGYHSNGVIKHYGFDAGGHTYNVVFETYETFSGKFGKIDFNIIREPGEYFDPTGDVMHKMSDTVRVMATIGAIINENTKDIDYLVIESTPKRMKSYRALISKLKDFVPEYEKGNRITLRKTTSPHMQGVQPGVQPEPAIA